jgi:succinylarginine dihydrolase
VKANVFYSAALHEALAGWVRKHYRETLYAKDLQDPQLACETMTALDELTGILQLGSVYDFQR